MEKSITAIQKIANQTEADHHILKTYIEQQNSKNNQLEDTVVKLNAKVDNLQQHNAVLFSQNQQLQFHNRFNFNILLDFLNNIERNNVKCYQRLIYF